MKALFSLGQTVATPGALRALGERGVAWVALIRRHQSGDWGTICDADRRENNLALKHGYRIMSVYQIGDGFTIWVITEADRSATTLLLPEEY